MKHFMVLLLIGLVTGCSQSTDAPQGRISVVFDDGGKFNGLIEITDRINRPQVISNVIDNLLTARLQADNLGLEEVHLKVCGIDTCNHLTVEKISGSVRGTVLSADELVNFVDSYGESHLAQVKFTLPLR